MRESRAWAELGSVEGRWTRDRDARLAVLCTVLYLNPACETHAAAV